MKKEEKKEKQAEEELILARPRFGSTATGGHSVITRYRTPLTEEEGELVTE